MPKDLTKPGLQPDELAAEEEAHLPEREAMSTFGHGLGHGFAHGIENIAMPINESSADNVRVLVGHSFWRRGS